MKNMRNRWIPIILLLAIIVITVTSCGSPSSIVGKWEGILNPGSSMEFFSDGRIELADADATLTGTYEIQEGNQLTITITGMFGGPEGEFGMLFGTYEINGDILTLVQQNQISTWRRAD